MKLLKIAVSLIFITTFASPTHAETADIDDLIFKAFSRNTKLESMKYETRASKFSESVVGSLPDPMISLGYINEGMNKITLGDDMADMTRFTLMLSQMFPFPGKLQQETEKAKYATRIAEIKRQNEKLSIIYNIKSLYLDLYRIQETKKLTNEKIKFLSLLESVAESKFRSAQGKSTEIIMFQKEKYMAYETLEMLDEQERSLKTSLAHITGQDSDVFGEFMKLPELTLDKSISEVYVIARKNSLSLLALENDVKMNEAVVKRAELDKYPDFTISAGYEPRFNDKDDVWTVGVSFNLPIYYQTKQKPAIDAALANKYKSDTLYADLRHELKSMITELVASIESSDRIMLIYKDGLTEKSRLLTESSLTGYRQGMMPASEIISAINSGIEYEIKYLNLTTQKQQKLSALNTITGGALYGTQIPE